MIPLTPEERAFRAMLESPRELRDWAARARDDWAKRKGFASYKALCEAHRRRKDCLDR